MFAITKAFNFHYGHRIWSQELDSKLSCDASCKCRFLHGHSAKVEVALNSDTLVNGMVTDFTNLKWFKQWIDETLDHKFVIDTKDPALDHLLGSSPREYKYHADNYLTVKYIGDEEIPKAQQEILESFVIVEFLPTSENLAKWLCEVVARRMNTKDTRVALVAFHESPTSSAVYKPEYSKWV